MDWYRIRYSVMGDIGGGYYMEFATDSEYYEWMEEEDEEDED